MPDFIEAVKDLQIDERAQQMIEDVNDMNDNFVYIFFTKKPLTSLMPFHPKNGVPLIESVNTPAEPTPEVSEEPKENGKNHDVSAEGELQIDEEENDGPPILVNQNEKPKLEKALPDKPYDVLYFGYLDENGKLYNGYGNEFMHEYTERLCSYDGPYYIPPSEDVSEPLGSAAKRDLADVELIQEYGEIQMFTFVQSEFLLFFGYIVVEISPLSANFLAFIDNKKRFQATADALNVPLEFIEAYIRHNYIELKTYFSQFERMIKMRARQRKSRIRHDEKRQDELELRRLTEIPKQLYNYDFGF